MTITKEEKVERFDLHVRKIIRDSIRRGDDDTALKALSSLSNFLYKWNQKYYDEELENIVLDLSRRNITPSFTNSETEEKTVLFYDSFGMDNRGLVINYLVSLGELGYSVIYVSPKSSENRQPVLQGTVKKYDVTFRYVDNTNSLRKVYSIDKLIKEYKPVNVFIYPHPLDISAIVLFTAYKGILTRFFVNLTDHAFWVGLNSFDYTLEFRNKGVHISREKRNIAGNATLLLPMYPFVDKAVQFEGLNPLFEGKKFIFSGGAIYKTLGDKEKLYYKMVRRLLDDTPDVLFLYAGGGSDISEMNKLVEDYPQRAMLIKERRDFYHLMQHCTIYLNTYPLFGGLMTQYAAVAGKLPITLCDKDRGLSGIISNRETLKVEFNNIDDLAKEVRHLLYDNNYLKEKERMLKGAIVTEEAFQEGLKKAMVEHDTGFEITDETLGDIDKFHATYRESFDFDDERRNAIGYNKSLLKYFPTEILPLLQRRFKYFIGNLK